MQGSKDRSQSSYSCYAVRPSIEQLPIPATARNKPNSRATRSHANSVNTLRADPPPDNMDSTIFFPVGSSVKHRLHGNGVVQTPPKRNVDTEFVEKMLVRVKFIECNTEWDLPMDGLVHVLDQT